MEGAERTFVLECLVCKLPWGQSELDFISNSGAEAEAAEVTYKAAEQEIYWKW